MCCDLVCTVTNFQSDSAKPFALSPQSICNWRHNALNVLWRSGCGGVKVDSGEIGIGIGCAHQQITDGSAH